jgi:hypothetical protein
MMTKPFLFHGREIICLEALTSAESKLEAMDLLISSPQTLAMSTFDVMV